VYLHTQKKATIFHFISGALSLASFFIFLKSTKYYWIYIPFLAAYMISGIAILAVFFKSLGRIQRSYFELLFISPFLLMAFFLLTRLFEALFFG